MAMAASCARRTLKFCSSKSLFSDSSFSSYFASRAAKLSGFAPAKPIASTRFSLQKLVLSRLPVELGAVQSLMPLHSVTASALLTSLLSLSGDNWGVLSEGFATPL